MVLLVAYSAWVYPFEVAFMHTPSSNKKIYIADTVVDLFFAIDIVLTFFVAYIDRTTHLLVRDKKKIVVRLVNHSFLSILQKQNLLFSTAQTKLNWQLLTANLFPSRIVSYLQQWFPLSRSGQTKRNQIINLNMFSAILKFPPCKCLK